MIKQWTAGGRSYIAVAFLFVMFVLTSCKTPYNSFYEWAFGNQEHGLTCDQLPPAETVDRALADHKDVVEQILAVNPGNVFLDVDRESCPGKADIVIGFASLDDSREIRAILGDRTFFNVPVRLRNQ